MTIYFGMGTKFQLLKSKREELQSRLIGFSTLLLLLATHGSICNEVTQEVVVHTKCSGRRKHYTLYQLC